MEPGAKGMPTEAVGMEPERRGMEPAGSGIESERVIRWPGCGGMDTRTAGKGARTAIAQPRTETR
jgi:hypothetical protein